MSPEFGAKPQPSAAQQCAIPLLNVLPREMKVDEAMIVTPRGGSFTMRQVVPPAPPCADGKRR